MEIDFFYLGLVFMVVHELDAVRCHEWRILPLLSHLSEPIACTLFIGLHVPLLYVLMIATLQYENEGLQRLLDSFFILHLGLHMLFLKHSKNEFKDILSWFLIVGAAFCAVLDLAS